ncbi:MAG: dihydrofolate reductase [Patescibacteria group bacterium]
MTFERVIGYQGCMPWGRNSQDLKAFKALTTSDPVGNVVIMGHTTWNSLPEKARPLPDRFNIVMSNDKSLTVLPGAFVAHSVEEALALVPDNYAVWVIGGMFIYNLFEPYADKIYITLINEEHIGDAFFPLTAGDEWQENYEACLELGGNITRNEYRRILPSARLLRVQQAVANAEQNVSDIEVVNTANAQSAEYQKDLQQIQKTGICPFCLGGKTDLSNPLLMEINDWRLMPNIFSYKEAKHAFLLIPVRHMTDVSEMTVSDFLGVQALVAWARKNYGIPGGAIALSAVAMRFGPTPSTGATVTHLHGHFITPHLNAEGTAASPHVNFPIG